MTAGRLAVVGAGAWGTALSVQATRAGFAPRLWVFEPELLEILRATSENPWFLPGVHLPETIEPLGDLAAVVGDAGTVVIAVPSHVFRSVARAVAPHLAPGACVLSVAKGIEDDRLARMSEILADELPSSHSRRVAVLSGPTFAHEVGHGQPTAAVLASTDGELARSLQTALTTPTFRLYTQSDVTGVELGGALKNVMAIATGIADGLELGYNARAALLTRGLAEITRLGVALGARARTLAGLAGLGDLILTCTGELSRNRRLGLALARGESLAEWQAGTRSVAEGVRTAQAGLALARRVAVATPVIAEVAAVLFERKAPREALLALLSRSTRPEEEPYDLTGTDDA
ncbi:MAG TPA: NAD(P)H-dependent glycerol-3-phosphate dehydrogenase [Methylomirabilota bacterium]|nr:NAD(P)H-dependent glycerol-3-phosphate dehydrogenase [Methylomirabilota bacterium]